MPAQKKKKTENNVKKNSFLPVNKRREVEKKQESRRREHICMCVYIIYIIHTYMLYCFTHRRKGTGTGRDRERERERERERQRIEVCTQSDTDKKRGVAHTCACLSRTIGDQHFCQSVTHTPRMRQTVKFCHNSSRISLTKFKRSKSHLGDAIHQHLLTHAHTLCHTHIIYMCNMCATCLM